MKRMIKVELVAGIDIPDDYEAKEEIEEIAEETIADSLYDYELFCDWKGLAVEDMGEWKE